MSPDICPDCGADLADTPSHFCPATDLDSYFDQWERESLSETLCPPSQTFPLAPASSLGGAAQS